MHLVSWAKFAPQARQSAGKAKQATGKGNPWLAGTIGEIVATASRINTFLAERYRRLVNTAANNAPSSQSVTRY